MSIIRVDDTTGAVLEVLDEASILETLIDYFRTAQTNITDFNEGSEARNLLGAVALSQYELYYYIGLLFEMGYPQTAIGDYLDQLGVLVNCYRQTANKSSGTVTFTIDEAISTDILIETGNIVTCSSNYDLTFTLTEDVTILAGQTSASGPVIADNGGSIGNVAGAVIDTLEENTTDENITVTNASALMGGSDTELDEEYRARILEAGQALAMGNISWYKSLVGNITGVHDCTVINMPFNQSYNVKILVNGDNKPTTDEVIEDIEEIFTLEDNRIGGIKVIIDKPTYSVVDIDITLAVKDDYSFATVQADVEANIIDYFQGGTTNYNTVYTGLSIAQNVVISTISMIIGNTPGVEDWTITDPIANVLIGSENAAQVGTITITEA